MSELESLISDCEKYISQKGIDENIIEAYYNVCRLAKNEGEIDTMLKCTARTKELIEKACMRDIGLSMWEIEKFVFNSKSSFDLLDKYYDVLLLEAQNRIVDSYFQYIEKKREPKDRFYMPRRKQLIKIGLVDALQGMIDDKYDILCVSLVPGAGKSTIEKFFHSAVAGWFPKDYSLFYSHSGDITRMYYDGVYDIVTNDDDYAWHDIFPNLSVTSTNAKMEQFNIGKYKPFPSVQCTSVGSKNAGKVRASKFLLVDDMIGGIEEALNPTILDKLWDKYAVDARQRKTQDTDGKPCKEIHIATRWSVHDVIGRIQNMYVGNPRVKTISVPDVDPVTGESNFDHEYFLPTNNYSWTKSLTDVYINRSLSNVRDYYSQMIKSADTLICHTENQKLSQLNVILREKEQTISYYLYYRNTEKTITALIVYVITQQTMKNNTEMPQQYL